MCLWASLVFSPWSKKSPSWTKHVIILKCLWRLGHCLMNSYCIFFWDFWMPTAILVQSSIDYHHAYITVSCYSFSYCFSSLTWSSLGTSGSRLIKLCLFTLNTEGSITLSTIPFTVLVKPIRLAQGSRAPFQHVFWASGWDSAVIYVSFLFLLLNFVTASLTWHCYLS